jgi:hypothetical protein
MSRSHSVRGCARVSLRVEQLEDRRVLNCTVMQSGQVLNIRGDNHSDVINVTDDGAGGITVNCNGLMKTSTFNGVSIINIRGGNRGTDVITYDLTGALSGTRIVNVHGGKGNRVLNVMVGANLKSGASLQFNENGGRGNDLVNFTDMGNLLAGSSLQFNSHGGRGNDTFNGMLAGNVEAGSFLGLDLGAGRGRDLLHVSALSDVHIAQGALVDIVFRGGRTSDQESFDYAGKVDGMLAVTANGGPSNDLIAINLSPAASSDGTILANVNGGPGNDNLRLAIPVTSSSSKLTVLATLDGGPGNDTCAATNNVTERNCENKTML